APGGCSPSGKTLPEGLFRHLWTTAARNHRRRDRYPDALLLARERARVTQRDRAYRHHESHDHTLRPQASAAAASPRWQPPLHWKRIFHAAPGPRGLRARLHPEEARRQPRQHQPHGGGAGTGTQSFVPEDENAGDCGERMSLTVRGYPADLQDNTIHQINA